MLESIQNSIFWQLAFNRSNYVRGLNYRKRYHTRELMSFHFVFVTNFIRDKNPLCGINCNINSLAFFSCMLFTIFRYAGSSKVDEI